MSDLQQELSTALEGSPFDEWSKEYDECQKNPPKEGDILTTMDDSPAIMVIELKEGVPPFIYGRAFVPEVVGSELGWFLQSVKGQGFYGWKCILMPRARTELIRRFGLQKDIVEVKSLRVIRLSQSGKSLLCEVNEYCPEEETKEEIKEEETTEETTENG